MFIEYFLSAMDIIQCFTHVHLTHHNLWDTIYYSHFTNEETQSQLFKSLFIYYFSASDPQFPYLLPSCHCSNMHNPNIGGTQPLPLAPKQENILGIKNSTIETNFMLIRLCYQVSTQDCWPGLIHHSSKQLFLHPHLFLPSSFSPDDFTSNII